MRLGVDGTPLVGPRTGVGNYTYDLVEALADCADRPQISLLPMTIRSVAQLSAPDRENVHVVRRPLPPRMMRKLWQFCPVPPLEALLRCDVFHGVNYLAPRSLRTPVVLTVHDLWFRDNPDDVGPTEAELARLLPSAIRHATAVVTVSDHVREQLGEWLPWSVDKTQTIYPAPHRRAPGQERPDGVGPDTDFVAMIGAVNPRKNIPLALQALRSLRQRQPDVGLVIAGGVSPGFDLPSELRRAGFDSEVDIAAVQLLGYCTDAQVNWLLAHARALLSTSVHEGFGMVPVEGMLAGCPVVAVAGGAVAEVTAGAVYLTQPDAGEVADALEAVLTDDALRARLIADGNVIAGRYDYRQTAEQCMQLYRSV